MGLAAVPDTGDVDMVLAPTIKKEATWVSPGLRQTVKTLLTGGEPIDDGARFDIAVRQIVGKRLTWDRLTGRISVTT